MRVCGRDTKESNKRKHEKATCHIYNELPQESFEIKVIDVSCSTLRILGLSMAGVGPSIAGVRALKTLSV